MRKQHNTGEKLFTVSYFPAVETALIQWLNFSLSLLKARLLSISLMIMNWVTGGRWGQV